MLIYSQIGITWYYEGFMYNWFKGPCATDLRAHVQLIWGGL